MDKAKRVALLVMVGALIRTVLRAHPKLRDAPKRLVRQSVPVAGSRRTGVPGLPLETEHLLIRPFVPEDAPDIHAVYADPDLLHRVPGKPSESLEDTRRTLDGIIEHQEEHGFGLWAVVEKETGRIVGDCGLVLSRDRGPEAELTYRLGRAHWCKGYAREAATEVLRFGLEGLNLGRVVAALDPDDPAAARMLGVMEKAGMNYGGTGRFHGREMFVYEASRRERAPR